MKKLVFFLLPLAIAITSCTKQNKEEVTNKWTVSSPNKGLSAVITLSDEGGLSYLVVNGADTIIKPSALGITRADQDFTSGLTISGAPETKTVDETYTMVTGKRKENRNNANELILTLVNSGQEKLQVVFRAYDEGVAFRYNFPDTKEGVFTVTGETTTFTIPTNGKAWLQRQGLPTEWGPAYEEFYTFGSAIGENAPDSSGWSYPALFNTNNNWILVTESDLFPSYSGTRLAENCANGVYKVRFPLAGDGLGTGNALPASTLPWATPWRTIIIGSSVGNIIESNLVHHLATPQIAGDFSWVKPGKASWSWWGEHDSPKDFKRLKEYINLAKEQNWEYCLIDANWDLMKNGGTVQDLIKYANSVGVPLSLWYNSGGPHNNVTERPRDIMYVDSLRKAEFKKLNEWGVKAVKIDFFQSDKQPIIKLYHDILKDAADNQIMVVFHGCTLPRGWSRTYPNLVSLEGIRGAEQYGWSNDFAIKAASHNTVVTATRNVVGPMDYTPVTFSDYDCCKHQTSNAHELALSVLFESGITHLADRVDSYRKQDKAVKEFLKVVPVTWDDTKFVAGNPNNLMVIARQKGDQWFVAGINGDSTVKELNVELPFIKEGKYKLQLYSDGADARKIAFNEAEFAAGNAIPVKMLPKGGFAAILKK